MGSLVFAFLICLTPVPVAGTGIFLPPSSPNSKDADLNPRQPRRACSISYTSDFPIRVPQHPGVS